jgi:hypothetical protein
MPWIGGWIHIRCPWSLQLPRSQVELAIYRRPHWSAWPWPIPSAPLGGVQESLGISVIEQGQWDQEPWVKAHTASLPSGSLPCEAGLGAPLLLVCFRESGGLSICQAQGRGCGASYDNYGKSGSPVWCKGRKAHRFPWLG